MAELSSTEKLRMHELKRKAVQYFQENGVPKKMEDILNRMFFENPDDVYGHLANYFETFAKTPYITKIQAHKAVDSRGLPTLLTEVYCMVKNHQRMLGSMTLSSECHLSEAAKPEDKDAEEKQRQASLTAAVEYIQNLVNKELLNCDPTQQEHFDSTISALFRKLTKQEEERLQKEKEENAEVTKTPDPVPPSPSPKKGAKSPKGGKGKGSAVHFVPDEPREKLLSGSHAVCAVSAAVCQAGAAANQLPLYKHVAKLRCGMDPEIYKMPFPVVTLLYSGKAGAGKLNCVKEFMVVPKPGMTLAQSMKRISTMYNLMANSFCQKAGAAKGGTAATGRLVNDIGALFPAFDRVEQGLDMIQETITQMELPEEEGFDIILDCGGNEMFDYDKGKYEVVAGQLKSGEDMVDFWADILERYPCIIGLIDPMRKQEKGPWMRLCERVSERCYIIGDQAYHRPGRLINEELTESFKTSGIVLRLEHINTVSDLLLASEKMDDAENDIFVSCSVGETPDTFLADLVVGMGAKFFKLGAPCRGERTGKLNRLLQLESCLSEEGRLAPPSSEHRFPHIVPPPEPEDSEPEEPEGRASVDIDKKSVKSEASSKKKVTI